MKRRIGFGVDQVLSDIAFQYHLKDQNTGWLLVGQSWLTVASLTENHHWWPLKEVHRPLGFMCVPLHMEETDDSHWPPIFAVPCTRAQLRPTALSSCTTLLLLLPPQCWGFCTSSPASPPPPGPNRCLPVSVDSACWIWLNLVQLLHIWHRQPWSAHSLWLKTSVVISALFLCTPTPSDTRSTSCEYAPAPQSAAAVLSWWHYY